MRWLLLGFLLTSCGVTNLRGRDVLLTELPYTFRNQALALQIGSPVVREDLPIALFLEGDGGQCQEYRAGLWRRFLQRFSGDVVLVRARGYVNLTCETDAWRMLDFHARTEELATQVTVLKAQFPGRKLVLIGHSAGAHVALQYAADHPGDVDRLVDLGGGVQDLAEILLEIPREKARLGKLDAADLPAAVSEMQAVITQVQQHHDPRAPFWGRTYAFWFQMFFAGTTARWHCPPVPTLIIHGERDLESVPFEPTRQAVVRNACANVTWLPIPGKGHDLLDPEVFRAIGDWLRPPPPPPETPQKSERFYDFDFEFQES
jgi:pimeloyl-ACP methyl ester carboxylesterase